MSIDVIVKDSHIFNLTTTLGKVKIFMNVLVHQHQNGDKQGTTEKSIVIG